MHYKNFLLSSKPAAQEQVHLLIFLIQFHKSLFRWIMPCTVEGFFHNSLFFSHFFHHIKINSPSYIFYHNSLYIIQKISIKISTFQLMLVRDSDHKYFTSTSSYNLFILSFVFCMAGNPLYSIALSTSLRRSNPY